jgi:HSP20 family protein
MTLTGFRPLRDFMTLRDAMDRLFDDSFVTPGRWFNLASNGNGTGYLPFDIYETPDEIVLRAFVPGVTPENLDVNYQQGVLTLRAKTEAPELQNEVRWYVRELSAGEVIRQVALPREVDVDHAQAAFEHGVLTLHLPKTAEAKPKQIKIGSGSQQQIGAGAGSQS